MEGNQCLAMIARNLSLRHVKISPVESTPEIPTYVRRDGLNRRKGRGDIKGEASKDPTPSLQRCPSFSRNESRVERKKFAFLNAVFLKPSR